MSIRILVGARVEGSHGPLITNPDASKKRRIRSKVIGTVVRAVGPQKWDVVFDYDGKSKEVSSKSLIVVPPETGIPVDERSVAVVVSRYALCLYVLTEACILTSFSLSSSPFNRQVIPILIQH